jgi:CII-binding regulator of phage lambda lysogenization HflD
MLRRLALNVHGVIDVVDDRNIAKTVEILESMKSDMEHTRLIDANSLIEELEKRVRTQRSTMEIVRDIIPMVQRQPTTYDVDKVVKEILDIDVDLFSNNPRKGVITSLPEYRREIINIVTRGGVDEIQKGD